MWSYRTICRPRFLQICAHLCFWDTETYLRCSLKNVPPSFSYCFYSFPAFNCPAPSLFVLLSSNSTWANIVLKMANYFWFIVNKIKALLFFYWDYTILADINWYLSASVFYHVMQGWMIPSNLFLLSLSG